MTRALRCDRRKAMLMLGAVALARPCALLAQQQKVRIGYLANDPDRASPTFQAFAAAMIFSSFAPSLLLNRLILAATVSAKSSMSCGR